MEGTETITLSVTADQAAALIRIRNRFDTDQEMVQALLVDHEERERQRARADNPARLL